MNQRDACPDENELVGFLEGALPGPDRAGIEAHCARCERCGEALAHAAEDSTTAAAPEDTPHALNREIESAVQGVLGDVASAEAIVGKRIGRFEIVAVQGRGQFGVVYRARDTQLGRMVAVKVMRRAGRQDRPLRETLFQTEAAAAARLQHPNIVTLHDYGEFEGAPYLILELLEGETLRSRLARQVRLAPADALAIAGDVASALVEAHAAGVIHRDIKPSNVFVCTSGQVKVLDLGLARLQDAVGAGESDPSGTAAVVQAGTPRYMAPELLRGRTADACTDVYAVGLMLFEMLAGPWSPGNGPSIAERIARARLSPRLRRLLRKATAAERADRFQDAGELLAALTRVRRQLTGSRRAVRRLGIALVGVALAATATVAVRSLVPSHRAAKPTVAVLGFDNLSGRSDTAWLSTALAEMLHTDLASSPEMHVVPPELVAHARTDLGLPDRGGLALRMLQDLHRYLGADYLVIGSYVPVASGAGTQTRLDVQVQDTRNQLIDSFSETAGDSELLDVAVRIGSRLRVRLDATAITPDEARTLRASMPATPEAARLYAEGLRRSRSSDLLEARDLLARAIAAEPGIPLAHAAFSQVLHALGEEARMRDEAKRAFELSGGLRREERLVIEAQYREAIDQWPQAREQRRMLHELFPDDLEYGLELADALDRHAEKKEALAVIAELRRLPPPQRDDPRIDLTEASAQRDQEIRKALAISAADKAKALGSRWILGRAREREATAEHRLGELDHALIAAEEARAIGRSIGDREGLSLALHEIATTRAERGEPLSVAIAIYEEALQLERAIGNTDEVAGMLGTIAYEYLMAGDPAQAAPRIDEMEHLAKRKVQTKAEEFRAIQWLEQGDLAGAFARLEHIQRTGDIRGFERKLLGEVLMAQGQLGDARASLDQYLARDWPSESSERVLGLVVLSRLELESGHMERAEAHARESVAICERAHNGSDLATAEAMLARVLVAEHRYDEAKAMAEAALGLATRSETMPEWIDARMARAQALLGLHPKDVDAALAEAQTALARARERGLVGQAFEARLVAGEIAAQGHRQDARAQLRALADEADTHGFGLIARKAKAAATAPRLTER